MIFKTELTRENVELVIDFYIANTVVRSMIDGRGIFEIMVHDSMSDKAELICQEINADRTDIAIRKSTYSWSYEDIYEEAKYGWFLYKE